MKLLINRKKMSEVGSFAKLHGYKGALQIALYDTVTIENYFLEPLFVEIDGLLVPFFFVEGQKVKHKTDGQMVVSLEGVDSDKAANKLINKKVFLRPRKKGLLENNAFDLLGFKVFSENKKCLGRLIKIGTSKSNPLLLIKKGVQELLIPLNGASIVAISYSKKKLKLKVQEGLLEFYGVEES